MADKNAFLIADGIINFGRACFDQLSNTFDQYLNIASKSGVIQRDRAVVGKRLQCVRKLSGIGYFCSLDQNRNQGFPRPESRFDLESDEVVRIVDASATLFVRHCRPLVSNKNEKYVGKFYFLPYGVYKIFTRRDCVNIHKHIFGAYRSY